MRFDSPELEGPSKNAAFSFGLQSYNEAELSSDTQTVPVHTEATKFSQFFTNTRDDGFFETLFDYSYLYMKFSYALDIPLELSFRFPDRLGLKYQILGPRAGEAKAGDFSFAFTTSYANRSSTSSIGASPSTTPTDSSVEMSRSIVDFAAIAGFRISNKVLLYGGPFILYTPYEVTQILNTSTATHKVRGQISSYGGNFGMQYRTENMFSFKLEATFNHLKGHNAEENFLHGGLIVSKAF